MAETTNPKPKPTKLVTAAIFTFILLAVALLIWRAYSARPLDGQVTSNSDMAFITQQQPQVGIVQDPTSLIIGSRNIALPEPWQVSMILLSTNNSMYVCSDPSSTSCIVQLVSNQQVDGDIVLAFSTEGAVRLSQESDAAFEKQEILLFGENVELDVTYYSIYAETVDPDTGQVTVDFSQEIGTIPRQMLGCASNGVCVNASNFSNQEELNQAQVDRFKELVGALVVQ